MYWQGHLRYYTKGSDDFVIFWIFRHQRRVKYFFVWIVLIDIGPFGKRISRAIRLLLNSIIIKIVTFLRLARVGINFRLLPNRLFPLATKIILPQLILHLVKHLIVREFKIPAKKSLQEFVLYRWYKTNDLTVTFTRNYKFAF